MARTLFEALDCALAKACTFGERFLCEASRETVVPQEASERVAIALLHVAQFYSV